MMWWWWCVSLFAFVVHSVVWNRLIPLTFGRDGEAWELGERSAEGARLPFPLSGRVGSASRIFCSRGLSCSLRGTRSQVTSCSDCTLLGAEGAWSQTA